LNSETIDWSSPHARILDANIARTTVPNVKINIAETIVRNAKIDIAKTNIATTINISANVKIDIP
jgi:hypothetical protein